MDDNDRLELERDLRFNRAEWRLQRIGWAVWALIILAGLVGLLGAGPLSHTSTASPDGAHSLIYHRCEHYHSPTRLRILLHHPNDSGKTIRLRISQEFLSTVEIQRIHPEPVLSEISGDGIIFSFELATGDSPSSADEQDVAIDFHIEHQGYGFANGRIELVGHDAIDFKQLVFP